MDRENFCGLLWLVTWIVERSDGSVSVERRDGSTVVTIDLERALA